MVRPAGVAARGAEGAALWHAGRWGEYCGYPVPSATRSARATLSWRACLAAWLDGQADVSVLDQALRVGAFVAFSAGATNAHDVRDLSGPAGAADR